ncbi:type II secretion system F family protein [Nocardioides bruguierae]|uniref:Type II secretion system F family protein n=1 Tax=Nocardioides bruguierae TaxID=2945102 RepID=A0A9X2IG34_9ACTN|nr:type II secretion system F family protein [Nocardioides bruguierae]MCM0621952.1 type II secretion system F family protein [Nocardioides bruguierae]
MLGLPAASAGLLLLVGVVAAGGLLLVVRRDLAARAAGRRAEFRRGLSLYLDLVVMSVEAGRGHAEALPVAARVGEGWVFAELQAAVASARVFGISTWRSLGEVGERLGVSELADLETSMSLAQDEGGRVRDSLVSRAQTMRDARAADIQARASRDTDAMRNTLVLMSLLAAAYVITARLLFLFTA